MVGWLLLHPLLFCCCRRTLVVYCTHSERWWGLRKLLWLHFQNILGPEDVLKYNIQQFCICIKFYTKYNAAAVKVAFVGTCKEARFYVGRLVICCSDIIPNHYVAICRENSWIYHIWGDGGGVPLRLLVLLSVSDSSNYCFYRIRKKHGPSE